MIKKFVFIFFAVILILFFDHCGTKNIPRYIQRNSKVRFFKNILKKNKEHNMFLFYFKNNQKHKNS